MSSKYFSGKNPDFFKRRIDIFDSFSGVLVENKCDSFFLIIVFFK